TGSDNTSTTFSGVLTGTGVVSTYSLTKTGTGTWTLAGNSPAYTNTLSILGGTLLVTGSLANGGIVVLNSPTLAGTGTVGTITVDHGGTVSPGTGPGSTGILTANGSVSFGSGSFFVVELNGTSPGDGYDQLRVMGMASLAGVLSATLGFTPGDGS